MLNTLTESSWTRIIGIWLICKYNNHDASVVSEEEDVVLIEKIWLAAPALLVAWSTLAAQAGLVAYYPFSGDAKDQSLNGNHLEILGPTLTEDRFGQSDSAFSFDGIDDLMRIPYNPSLYPESFGVSLWVKVRTQPVNGKFIMTNSADEITPPFDPFRLRLKISGKVAVRYEGNQDGLWLELESSTRLDPGRWYFIVTYYDGESGEAALFINGQLEDRVVEPMALDTNELGLVLGARQNYLAENDTTAFFAGCLDDLRIFNRALSPREIEKFFVEGGPSESKLKILQQNFPNPFNPETTISYELIAAARVQVHIYNVMGQEVRELFHGSQPKGVHSLRWDGRDRAGFEVSSGLYVYRVTAGTQSVSRKMLLIK